MTNEEEHKKRMDYMDKVTEVRLKCNSLKERQLCDGCFAIESCIEESEGTVNVWLSKPNCDDWWWYVGEETDYIPMLGHVQLKHDEYTCDMLMCRYVISSLEGKWSKLIYPE